MWNIFEKVEGLPVPTGAGCTSIPVLEFLKGMPWDEFAMNFVYGLRPSKVRTSTGELTSDMCTNRVTVILEKDEKIIRYIEQEIEVGLLGEFSNGYEIDVELTKRLKKQEK